MSKLMKDPVFTPPTLETKFGRAWSLNLETLRKACNITAEQDCLLAIWFVEVPWAHMFWHSYAIVLAHLRPLEGVVPPTIYLADATHEIDIFALDPDKPRQSLMEGTVPFGTACMQPANFGAQFIATDEDAAKKVRGNVEQILAGQLSPDSDYANVWGEIYNFSMFKDHKHAHN
jgi:hypothetical protein